MSVGRRKDVTHVYVKQGGALVVLVVEIKLVVLMVMATEAVGVVSCSGHKRLPPKMHT